MRRLAQLFIAASVVGAAMVVPTAGAGPAHKNRYPNNETVVVECADASQGDSAGTITYTGPLKLWPPNHKYSTATVTAADEDGGDDVSLTTTATHDQYDGDTEVNGSGNTADDITPAAQTTVQDQGSVTQTFQIRAERSGRLKEGRTYTITARAIFSDSDGDDSSEDATECDATFTVHVPHDMRPSNR